MIKHYTSHSRQLIVLIVLFFYFQTVVYSNSDDVQQDLATPPPESTTVPTLQLPSVFETAIAPFLSGVTPSSSITPTPAPSSIATELSNTAVASTEAPTQSPSPSLTPVPDQTSSPVSGNPVSSALPIILVSVVAIFAIVGGAVLFLQNSNKTPKSVPKAPVGSENPYEQSVELLSDSDEMVSTYERTKLESLSPEQLDFFYQCVEVYKDLADLNYDIFISMSTFVKRYLEMYPNNGVTRINLIDFSNRTSGLIYLEQQRYEDDFLVRVHIESQTGT